MLFGDRRSGAEAYDADGGGTIDPEEFADLLEACRPDMTPEERTATFSVRQGNL